VRKPKVIIFDSGAEKESALKQFFDARSYETMVVMQPRFCPVYGKEGADPSTCYRLCSDIIVIVENGLPMYGAKLLAAQLHHGCGLTPRNKAIISGMLTNEERNGVKAMEAAVFRHPLDFDEFEAWLQGCRKRMDLSKPLAIKRRAPRLACSMSMEVRYRVLSAGEVGHARALNRPLRLYQDAAQFETSPG
jgi:hypothetical protein